MLMEKLKRLTIRISKLKLRLSKRLLASWTTFKAFRKLSLNPKKDFPDTSPNDDAELVEHYVEMMDNLIFTRGAKVKEIAVTGPFSGGKSSFLRTYMKQRPSLLIEVISLAAFKSPVNRNEQALEKKGGQNTKDSEIQPLISDVGCIDQNNESKENKIEKSILQQLLYRTSSSRTTYSRFRRIFPRPLGSVTGVFMSIWLVITGVVFHSLYTGNINASDVISKLLAYDTYSLQRYLSFEFVCIVLLTALPILLLKDGIQFFRSYSITKLNPLKGEFAFTEKSTDSIFNKYLEEIIYYFAEQKTDIVIFEDLDRFESPEIFVNLKELNKLLNDSADVKQPVRFVYALKDDVFKGKTRTKFFDSIIPIVPYASTSNSYPELKKLLKKYRFNKDFSDEFIRNVAVFLDDMRMINNIVAEYLIYKDVLMESSQDRDFTKLFAFIIYKNNYSDDFALLNEKSGKLADFFKGISQVKQEAKKLISDEISKLEERIKDIENEQLESEDEIVHLFFSKFINENYNKQQRNFPQIFNADPSDLLDHSNFMTHYDSTDQHSFPTSLHSQRNQRTTFKVYVEQLFPSFDERLHTIRAKTSNKLNGIQIQIRELEQKSAKVGRESITSLCNEYGRDHVFKTFDIDGTSDPRKYDLLKHMIERGYIDQHYHLYIYHHRDGVLNSEDLTYLKTVKRGMDINAEYLPTNISEFIKYYDNHDYSRKAFFNVAIINQMLSNPSQEGPIRIHMASAYSDAAELLELFLSYREQFSLPQRIAWLIYTEMKDFILKMVASEVSDTKKLVFLDDIIRYSCTEGLHLLKEEQVLSEYLSTQQSLLNKASTFEQTSLYLKKLEEIGVCFEDIHQSEHLPNVMNILFEKNMYFLNYPNFRAIVKACFDTSDGSDETLVLDDLFAIEKEHLIEFLSERQDFIANQIIKEYLVIQTSEIFAVLLSSNILETETKIQIVKVTKATIDDLINVTTKGEKAKLLDEKIIECLIAEKKLSHNERIQNQLIDFGIAINDSYIAGYFEGVIEAKSISKDLKDSSVKSLLKLLFNNDVTTYAEQVINVFKLKFDEFLISICPEEILKKNVNRGRVTMTVENYQQIYSINVDIALLLLSKDYRNADYSIDGINFTQNEFYMVMASDFHTDFKHFLLMNHSKLLSKDEDNDSVIDFIVAFKKKDGEQLILSAEILKMLLEAIPSDKKERRLNLFSKQLHNLDKIEAKELLLLVDSDLHSAIVESKQPRVNGTPEMKNLLDLLKSNDMISSYIETFGKFKVYPKRG